MMSANPHAAGREFRVLSLHPSRRWAVGKLTLLGVGTR